MKQTYSGLFNFEDPHGVKPKWKELNSELNSFYDNVYSFFGYYSSKKSGKKAHKSIRKLLRLIIQIRKSIIAQKKDYDNQY